MSSSLSSMSLFQLKNIITFFSLCSLCSYCIPNEVSVPPLFQDLGKGVNLVENYKIY